MAEVLEGSGERQVVGLRGRGQDVVHSLGSLYRGQERKRCAAVSAQSVKKKGCTLGVFTGGR